MTEKESIQEKRSPMEYEFIMDGITTRMQMALDKLSDSNKLMGSIVRIVCATMIIVMLAMVANNYIWIRHANALRNNQTIISEVAGDEALSQFRPGASD